MNFQTDVTQTVEEIKTDVNSVWMATLGCSANINNERAEYTTLDLNFKWNVGVEICNKNTMKMSTLCRKTNNNVYR